ncbi:MAG: thioredoxin family protein [bacterium]|nr:thioredoxin family protein [bacterium]
MFKKIFLLNLVGFILFFSLALSVLAQDKTELIYFWGDGCPHCAKESKFLEQIKEKYPELAIIKYEVWYNTENQKLFTETAKGLGITQLGVPLTIIGDKYFIGYTDDQTTGKAIEEQIKSILIPGGATSSEVKTVKLPFFGEVDLTKMSLPLLTITIGALDGFNPCAMWILLFLIALLINVHSRKKLLLIGGTFIFTSGLVYFIFLSAWLNLFLVVGYINLIRILIGILALGIGLWQIKNFIQYKPGTCKITDGKTGFQEKIKNGLKDRVEKLALSPLTFGVLAGVAVLAFGVNLLEFFCSAGLPAIYTKILTMSHLSSLSYYLYLLLYTFIFILDDLIVFSLAIIALNRFKFAEKYNYWTTLIGGILILILGFLLIFKPNLLMFG